MMTRTALFVALTRPLAVALALGGCGASDEADFDDADMEPEAIEQDLVLRKYDEPTTADKNRAAAKYAHVDPNDVIPKGLLRNALGFLEANREHVANENYLGVIDFSKHSSKRRFFVVNLATGSVASHVTAHGSGSDPSHTGYAKYFSNVSGSNKSSLGYYLTAETYNGKHGYSLRLDGASDTNSRVRSRSIVIHGASYVEVGRSKQGRSYGCPAVDQDEKYDIIRKLKGGAVIYAERSSVVN